MIGEQKVGLLIQQWREMMPEHIKGESRDGWMARCIPTVIAEGKTPEQAAGQCGGMYDSWKKANMSEPETYDLTNVEIFAAGTWQSEDGRLHKFDKSSLQNIVEAFKELKGMVDPPLKLGHSIKQELLASGGLPAAGWLDNLKIKGDKILADFKKIPSKIYKIIKNGGLKRVSPEIVYDYQAQPGGKKYPLFLEAVALLGIEQKAMKTLNDFVNVYSEGIVNDVSFELDFNTAVFTEGVIHNENSIKTNQEVIDMELEKMLEKKEKEVDELKVKFSESESKVETLTNDLNEVKESEETLKAENEELKGKVAQFTEEAKKKEISDYVDSKIKEGKIPAALKEDWIAQFSELPEDKIEGMKKIVDNTPSVDFGEHSLDTSEIDESDHNKINKATGEPEENADTDAKVKAYMSEHNVNYETANLKLIEQGVI
jgi:hypothetical protein